MFQIIQGKSSDEWRRIFEDLKAFWVHDGNPKRPHALLTGANIVVGSLMEVLSLKNHAFSWKHARIF